jgi:uncharacterized protein (DUF58 family)
VTDTEERRPAVTTAEWLARRRAREEAIPEVARTARNLQRRARLRPTGRGWGSLGVGMVAVLLAYMGGRRELLVIACAAFLLPLLGLLVVRLRRPRFEVLRTFAPPVVAVGDVAQVRLRIRNAGGSTSPVLDWNDAIPWHEPDVTPRRLAPIPAGSAAARVRVEGYELHPRRRGVYAIGPLVVEDRDPFCVATSIAALGEQDRLIVIPEVGVLPPGGPALADGEGAALLVQRRVTGNDDDLTTREYRSGDALRRVHWRASARHGELMVRQEEHRSRPDAHLIVDTRFDGHPDAREDAGETWEAASRSESFEWVVRMTASLGIHLEANGFRVGIEETAPAQIEQLGERWEGGRRSEGFLTSLAAVRLLDRPATDLAAAAHEAPGPIFAVVGDPEDATVEWMIRRRRGAEFAVAFAVEPRPEATERLRAAGWSVVPVERDLTPGEAWLAVGTDLPSTHVPSFHAADRRREDR